MSKAKILIVDDEQDFLHIMNDGLKAQGFDVAVASDGLSAIPIAKEQKPDLILLDIAMPAGNGFTVMKRLKNMTPLSMTPIIIITGLDKPEYIEDAKKAGAQGYLKKPFGMDELLEKIQEALKKPNAVAAE